MEDATHFSITFHRLLPLFGSFNLTSKSCLLYQIFFVMRFYFSFDDDLLNNNSCLEHSINFLNIKVWDDKAASTHSKTYSSGYRRVNRQRYRKRSEECDAEYTSLGTLPQLGECIRLVNEKKDI